MTPLPLVDATADRPDVVGGRPQVRVARQGIYDQAGTLVAHELLFRGLHSGSSGIGTADETLGDHATSAVIASTFGDFGIAEVGGGLPLYLNLTRAFLVGSLPLPFGSDGVVLEILEDVVVDDEVIDGVRNLKARGFRLALDDFVGEPDRVPLLGEVDIVKVDVLTVLETAGRLDDVLALCREHAPAAMLLAERVEDEAALETCRLAGFHLFQGYHFQPPVLVAMARMSPSQLACLRLLRTLSDPGASTADIERIVATDPGLALRVLRSANSAIVAQPRVISSLRQAVVLLGPPALSAWVTLTLLGGLTPGARQDLVTVLARAACCESLAGSLGAGVPPPTAFLVGMLSGVAQVTRTDVRQVAAGSGLGGDLVAALTEGAGELGLVLRAVVAHERGQPDPTGHPELTESAVSLAYLQSWSQVLARVTETLDG